MIGNETTWVDSERSFRLLTDAVPQIIWLTDSAGRLEFFNRQWVAYTGSDELWSTPAAVLKLVHPDDQAPVFAMFQEAYAAGTAFSMEHRLRSATGEYRWFLSRAEPYREPGTARIVRWIGTSADIHDRRTAEAALRVSEERQAYLLKLSDALRPLGDPVEVQREASRVLGEHLGANRVFYVERLNVSLAEVGPQYADGVEPIAGRYRLESYDTSLIERLGLGQPVLCRDVEADPKLSAAQKANFAQIDVGSWVIAPMIKEGVPVARLVICSGGPREWTPLEVELIVETADRTWSAVERARAELAERESRERYRTVFNAIDEGFALGEVITDESGKVIDYRLVDLNPAYGRMTGISNEQRLGRRSRRFMPNLEPYWYEAVGRAGLHGETVHYEDFFADIGRWLQGQLVPAGTVGDGRFGMVFSDVTDRRRRQANQEFLAVVLDDLAALTAPGDMLAAVGKRLGSFLGVAAVVMVEMTDADEVRLPYRWSFGGQLDLPDDFQVGDLIDRELLKASSRSEVLVIDDTAADPLFARLVRATGVRALIRSPWRAQPDPPMVLAVASLEPRQWRPDEIELVEDLADRLVPRLERARSEEAARHERERHETLEREFIANASHELRTPLAGIIGAVEALEAGAKHDPAHRDRFFGHLKREAERLARLSDSLLLLAQADAAEPLATEDVRLRPFLDTIASRLQPSGEVAVLVRAPEKLCLHTNRGLAELLVTNLATNAAKYTTRGHIELKARRRRGTVVVEVADTGPGMSAETRQRAFDRFYRGGSRDADGFGLGLSIVGQVARVVGATLQLDSAPGRGTVARLIFEEVT